jgi:hypothetical protein
VSRTSTTTALLIAAAVTLSSIAILAQRGSSNPAPAVTVTPRDISGFWELPLDGRRVPAARLAARVTPAILRAEAAKNAKAIRWCNWVGMPTTMDVGRPLDIRQGTREIIILAESPVTPVRHLYLDRATHIDKDVFDPNTSGDSIARWEGDTLIVDTIGFEPTHGITAIPGGGFRTATSRLVEHYRLVKNGAVLSVTFTWTDPAVFAAPHTYEFRYQRVEAGYEARPYQRCDPFDAERAAFLDGAR